MKLNRNNTNFPLELLDLFKSAKFDNEYQFLKYYQNIVRLYVEKIDSIESGNNQHVRGLLVYHTMGMGKSILAIAVALELIKTRKPVMLLAKSLQENMKQSIKKYINIRRPVDPDFYLCQFDEHTLDKWIDNNFSFVSMNASNMLKQLNKATNVSQYSDEFDSLLEDKIGEIIKKINLEGKLLIVDEAHNLFRAIINGSKNAHGLYDMIMNARNLKILFLTGTPITNDPFELSPCFNMLAGDINNSILPTNYKDFQKLYVDVENGQIKNKSKFQNRIFGLVSHVSHLTVPGKLVFGDANVSSIEFPEERPIVVEYVNMDNDQYAMYQLARDKEKEEGSSSGKYSSSLAAQHGIVNTPSLTKPKGHSASTYRVKSRQLSNFCPPKGFADEKDPNKIPESSLGSAKYRKIVNNLDKHDGQLGLIYSQFIGVGGLGTLSRYLKYLGWTEFNAPESHVYDEATEKIGGDVDDYMDRVIDAISNNTNGWWVYNIDNDYTGSADTSKVFAMITGATNIDNRDMILNVFNSDENMHGSKIALLLVSSTGAEGIDLKNVRHVHILEQYWNWSRIKQVIARAARNDSHVKLPQEEKNVTPYLYLAIPPENEKSETKGYAQTTDTELYNEAIAEYNINESFMNSLKEVSIECLINGEPYCKICAPTNMPLYTNDPNKDVMSTDNCKAFSESTLRAKEIIVDDVKYYYVPDKSSVYDYKVYTYNNITNAYKSMLETDPIYLKIVDMIS